MRKYTALNDRLYDYMLAQRTDVRDPVLDRLRKETAKLGRMQVMAISQEQCSFLTFLTAAIGAKYAVEVGTFTGSSALGIARGLPAKGKLVCFDMDEKWTAIARRHWKKAGVDKRIELRIGDAAVTLKEFKPTKKIDFVFIDANKDGYDFYYETLLPFVRKNGVIAFDNMFRGGEVLTSKGKQDIHTHAVDRLNRKLAKDRRVQSVLVPIADGIHFCRKL